MRLWALVPGRRGRSSRGRSSLRLGLQPLAPLFLVALFLTGCGSSNTSASTQASAAIWTRAPISTGDQARLVKSFNRYLANRKAPPASPTQLALEFVRADRTQAALTTSRAQSSPEGGGPTTVTVVQDRLADDSVRRPRVCSPSYLSARGCRPKPP